MYLPRHFAEDRVEVLHDLIRTYPLATIVTLSPDGLNANHIPLYLRTGESERGTLVGHVAQANPLWQEHRSDLEALAIFQGANAYISPNWYATKQETGKVVPTWNYMVVHARGPLRVHQEPEWIHQVITELTDQQEVASPAPWAVDDAPAEYIDRSIGAIVGIEIPITRLEGKWKVSQNQPEANRKGVIAGLEQRGDESAQDMSEWVRRSAPESR